MTMRIVRRPRLSWIGKKCPPGFKPGALTMGGGQLYCIGLTRRPLLGLSLLPHPKSSLALARTRVQWPFCSPLCLSIRTSIVPSVLFVGMTASLLKLLCRDKRGLVQPKRVERVRTLRKVFSHQLLMSYHPNKNTPLTDKGWQWLHLLAS